MVLFWIDEEESCTFAFEGGDGRSFLSTVKLLGTVSEMKRFASLKTERRNDSRVGRLGDSGREEWAGREEKETGFKCSRDGMGDWLDISMLKITQ
jgi:hypothetical protein